MTSIGFDAFGYCTALAYICIPDSVMSIEAKAFSYCHQLVSVTLPKHCKGIDREAFYHCMSIQAMHLSSRTKASDGVYELLETWKDAPERICLMAAVIKEQPELLEGAPQMKSAIQAERIPLFIHAVKLCDAPLAECVLRLGERFSIQDLVLAEEHLLTAEATPEVTTVFLQYKHENYTPEEIRAFERKSVEDIFD